MELQEGVEAVADALRQKKSKKSDTAYRLVVVILLLALLYVNLFMENKYVTRDDYKADQKAGQVYRDKQDELISRMHDEILTLINADKINAAQNEELHDHESRIRRLESRARLTSPKDTDPNGP